MPCHANCISLSSLFPFIFPPSPLATDGMQILMEDNQLFLYSYGFQGAEHPIQHPPHQNARKGSTPYKRTKPSTMKRIKEIAKHHKAKEIIEIIDSEKGSIEHIDSVTDLPRDRQQIRNVRRNLFAAILQKCKVDNDEPFIRCVQAVPEPACIVATNHQLKQMEVNCTDENFSIVTVDPTFNLGEFYVTPMVFMQKKFVRKHIQFV